MKHREQPWVVLFGGANREGVIERMIKEGVNIRVVLVPIKHSAKLKASIERLTALGLEVVAVKKDGLAQELNSRTECLLLSVGFPYLVPKDIYSKHRLALNLHPTRLPKYRGPTSGAFIIINNETESGSTVHYLEEEADRGSIIAQSKVSLTPFDTLRSLQRKVYEKEPSLIIEAIENLDSGTPPIPQEEAESSSYLNRRTPADSEIDPARPLIELVNEIRAADREDFPAFFYYHGEKVCVSLWRENKPEDSLDEL